MVADPAPTPDTTPLALTVATALLLLLHEPPVTEAVRVMLALTHTTDGPFTEGAPEHAVVLKVTSLP